jgi:phosphoribosylamine--glycine ligase
LITWSEDSSVCVVAASGGYPGQFETAKVITGLEEAKSADGVVVFHAGTKRDNSRVVTSGGRVLGVTARGSTLEKARERAYGAMGGISFEGLHYRTDVAKP